MNFDIIQRPMLGRDKVVMNQTLQFLTPNRCYSELRFDDPSPSYSTPNNLYMF